jgi:serine/threonine protein kinase
MAPEVHIRGCYSFKADIYGFGVLIAEFLTGERGYQGSVGQVRTFLINHIWIKVLPSIYWMYRLLFE